jgi:hypothetical protein
MLAFGDRAISLVPPAEGSLAFRIGQHVGPFAKFVHLQQEADELIYELIDERRAEHAERDDDWQEGFEYAMRELAAHLRQGDFLPDGTLFREEVGDPGR